MRSSGASADDLTKPPPRSTLNATPAQTIRRELDRAPEATRWGRVLDLVERCEDAELARTVRALKMQLSRWRPSPTSRWKPDGARKFPVATGSEWHSSIPYGEHRVAPIDWIEEMAAGARSPKYGLVRAIHLQGLGLTAAQIATLLSCPDLTDLRRLDTRSGTLDAACFEALRAPHLKALEHLLLSSLGSHGVEGAVGEAHTISLDTLTVECSYDKAQPDAFRRLLRTELMRRVDEIHLMRDHQERFLEQLGNINVAKNLRTLGLRTHVATEMRSALGHRAFRRVERACVSLVLEVMSPKSTLATLTDHFATRLNTATHGARGIRHIDLSGTTQTYHGYTNRHVVDLFPDAMTNALGSWQVPGDVELVTLGPWWSAAAAERLAHEWGVRVLESPSEE